MVYSAKNDPQMKELIAHQIIRDELVSDIVANIKALREIEPDLARAQDNRLFKLIVISLKAFLYHSLAIKDPVVQKTVTESALNNQAAIMASFLLKNYNGKPYDTMLNLMDETNKFYISISRPNGQQQPAQSTK